MKKNFGNKKKSYIYSMLCFEFQKGVTIEIAIKNIQNRLS